MKRYVVLLFFFIPALSFTQPVKESTDKTQFVLFDLEFTYTKADAENSTPSKSHYYVTGDKLKRETPKNWASPIDYRNGTVHIRIEVKDKPAGGAPTTWTLCYIPNKGIYDQDFDRDSNTIEVFVTRIRKKLGADVINTIRGLGYSLDDPDA